MVPLVISKRNGVAYIAGTGIPVWAIERCRRRGMQELVIRTRYPQLTEAQFQAAWTYARENDEEIDEQIRESQG